MPSIARIAPILALVTIAVSAFFVRWPEVDLAISGLFGSANGFPIANQFWAEAIRQVLMWATRLIALVTLVWLVVTVLSGSKARVNWRLPGFALLSFVIGPWLVVNEVLKSFWGRARPRDVAEFGGDAMFTPAWQITDQCATNCSFVSGEAGMSVATVLIIAILFQPYLRRSHIWVLGLLGFTGAGMRVLVGAHFASDAVLSALFCSLIVLMSYQVLNLANISRAGLLGDIWADLRRR